MSKAARIAERRGLPSDLDAERALLHTILKAESIPAAVRSAITDEHLTVERHRLLYRAMLELDRAGLPIQPVTLVERLNSQGKLDAAGGIATVSEFMDPSLYYGSVDRLIGRLDVLHQRRGLMALSDRIATQAARGPVDPALLESLIESASSYKPAGENQKARSTLKVHSVAELLGKEFPPGDELLPGLLDKQGAFLVSGPQKVGKSHLATQLSFALAGGQQLLDFPRGNSGEAYPLLASGNDGPPHARAAPAAGWHRSA